MIVDQWILLIFSVLKAHWLFLRTGLLQAQFKEWVQSFYYLWHFIDSSFFMRNRMENRDNNTVMDSWSEEGQCQFPCQTSVTVICPWPPCSVQSTHPSWVPVIESTKQGFNGLYIKSKCRHHILVKRYTERTPNITGVTASNFRRSLVVSVCGLDILWQISQWREFLSIAVLKLCGFQACRRLRSFLEMRWGELSLSPTTPSLFHPFPWAHPSTIWWLTTECDSISRGSDALFWPLWALHVQACTDIQADIKQK